MFIFLFSLFFLNRVQAAPFDADIKFFYYLENHWNYQGGIEEKNITTGAGFLEVDMSEQKFFPSMGYTQVYFSLMSYHGGSAAMQVGDTQWTSNIDSGGPEFIKIYDAYINQELFSDKFRFRVGLLDLCIDYNVNEVGLLFIHSAPGTSVDLSFSGANGAPIYPFPSFGFDLQFEHESGFYAMAAITSEFAGNSKNIDRTQTNPRISGDSNFHILEVGLEKDDSKMGLGYWGYASPFEHLTKAGQTNYQQGLYVA